MVRHLVERLPAMITPSWLRNRTQPIAVSDVLEYLAQGAKRQDSAGREIQIGGPDVVTYGELMEMMADVLGGPPAAAAARAAALPAPVLALDRTGHARRRGVAM